MRVCSVMGCDRKARARGWCGAHYHRWSRHGDPEGGRTSVGDPMLWIEALATQGEGEGCRDWPFRVPGGSGYPFHQLPGGREKRVAHLVLELSGRPRPPAPGDCALHSCDRPICCAPWHLRWGTKADNSADAVARGRTAYKGPLGYGEQHSGSVLTAPKVLTIRELRQQGLTIRAIAEKFEVGDSTIDAILSGRTWKHLL